MKLKIETVIATVHGQATYGEKMALLNQRLEKDYVGKYCIFKNITYPKVNTIENLLGVCRRSSTKIVASEIESLTLQYPNAIIIIIGHSNGTRAIVNAIVKSKTDELFPRVEINKLILLGCVVKRKFDWNLYPEINVVNIVSTNDRIVWFAKWYGMGRAGREGFIKKAPNLKQIFTRHGHSGFMKHYNMIKNVVFN